MSETATLVIERVAAGGDGIARHDGMVVFVPRGLPGDTVTVALTRQRTFARGRVLERSVDSALREAAPCVHYERDHCGGCQIQGLAYAAQLDAKAELIRDAVVRIGKQSVDSVHVTPSPSPWHYRNALTLAMQRDRMRPSGWRAGMYVAGDATQQFELTDCLITMPAVMDGWRALIAVAENLPRATTLRTTIRLLSDGGLALTVEGGSQWKSGSIDALVSAMPAIRAIWWIRDDEVRSLRYDQRTVQEAGASFAQVNPAVAALVRERVLDAVAAVEPTVVVDAYCGSGALTTQLIEPGRRVTGIELDAEASAVASAAVRHDPTARIHTGRVEHVLPLTLPADVVILNPPRAGVDAVVPTLLAAEGSGVQRIVYVSCDPATLGRDIARLGSGWTVSAVQGFDMFPQTAHVETVCIIDRRSEP